jgi:hypothetical protein
MPTIGMSDGTIAALLNQIESGEARAIDIVCHQRT